MAEATWNQWRSGLATGQDNNPSGETGYSTANGQTTTEDDEFEDDEYAEEPDESEQEDEPEEPPQYASSPVQLTNEQLEQIFAKQQEQFQKQQRDTAEYLRTLSRPQQQQDIVDEIEAPSFRELRRAIEENDMEKYEQLLAQQSAANDIKWERRLRQLAGEATQYFARYDEHIAQTVVPEYKDYEAAINEIKKDLPPIPKEYMNHPGVRRLFVNAARGMNIEAEVQRRSESEQTQRRRRANPQTGAPTNQRQQTRRNARRSNEPVFTDEAYAALRAAGRTPDQHAQRLGYANWSEYEKATQTMYDNWDEMNIPAWRRKANG